MLVMLPRPFEQNFIPQTLEVLYEIWLHSELHRVLAIMSAIGLKS